MATKDYVPMRVTLEGKARVRDNGIVRLVLDDGPSIIVHVGWPSVVDVEQLTPAREWRDGDVVQSDAAVYERRGGAWHSTASGSRLVFPDSHVTALVETGARILRYQAGEQNA